MFENQRYVTKGVANDIPSYLQVLLWCAIESMEVESMDYLQVFELSYADGKQKIIHSQELPNYKKEYLLDVSSDTKIVTAKIFVIDDETHTTMLLANEY